MKEKTRREAMGIPSVGNVNFHVIGNLVIREERSGLSMEIDPEDLTGLIFLRSRDREVTMGFTIDTLEALQSLIARSLPLAKEISR